MRTEICINCGEHFTTETEFQANKKICEVCETQLEKCPLCEVTAVIGGVCLDCKHEFKNGLKSHLEYENGDILSACKCGMFAEFSEIKFNKELEIIIQFTCQHCGSEHYIVINNYKTKKHEKYKLT